LAPRKATGEKGETPKEGEAQEGRGLLLSLNRWQRVRTSKGKSPEAGQEILLLS
jgi:hypothetical protein